MPQFEKKMIARGLADQGSPLMAEVEAEIVWNRSDPKTRILKDVLSHLNINSLCFSQPAEPYRSMIDYLALSTGAITLRDNETRLFLHDLPVVRDFSARQIASGLKRRKAVIIAGHGIVTHSAVTMEQCYVLFSSVLFACFVKFMADYLEHAQTGQASKIEQSAFENAIKSLAPAPRIDLTLQKAPFRSEEQVYRAIIEAGKPIVNFGLVDSAMGNISYQFEDTLYISQTGSFLDELEGCIDPCPLDHSACTGITASTELPAHLGIVTGTDHRAILHGHPKFAVIMSLMCDRTDCEFKGQCHTQCPHTRYMEDIPIVPGESGTGPNALCHTVPQALKSNPSVIVYGHGVFSAASDDFNQPLQNLVEIESRCRTEYFERLRNAGMLG